MNPLYRTFSRLTGAAALLVVASSAAFAQSDNFNRPDAATLGPNWTQQVGTSGIIDNQAHGDFSSLATLNGAISNVISFDIFNIGGGTQYIAGVLGYGSGDNYYVKVQNNGSGTEFDTYGFYTGNNSGVLFANLSGTFTSAHVTVSMAGTIATLFIEPNVGAAQTYSFDYGYTPGGTGVGLGFYGNAQADNFTAGIAQTATPEPSTYALMATGLMAVGFVKRRKRA